MIVSFLSYTEIHFSYINSIFFSHLCNGFRFPIPFTIDYSVSLSYNTWSSCLWNMLVVWENHPPLLSSPSIRSVERSTGLNFPLRLLPVMLSSSVLGIELLFQSAGLISWRNTFFFLYCSIAIFSLPVTHLPSCAINCIIFYFEFQVFLLSPCLKLFSVGSRVQFL